MKRKAIFKYSAIGDNSPENREHLEKLGYNEYIHLDLKNEPKYILTDIDDETYFYDSWLEDSDINDYINCIGNTPLFQAVTAMRDDIDKEQHFTNGDAWLLCTRHSFGDYAYIYGFKPNKWHKATLEELKEHFK